MDARHMLIHSGIQAHTLTAEHGAERLNPLAVLLSPPPYLSPIFLSPSLDSGNLAAAPGPLSSIPAEWGTLHQASAEDRGG
ncbi:hypothetical protein MHYP_G00272620 [Metynnis hypsauchen]